VPSTLDKVADTGGTPAADARLEWHVPSSMAQTTWRVPAATGPTRVIGDDDWRATTPVTGRQRAVEGPEPGRDAPRATSARPAPATFPEGIASSSGGTRLTDAWRPAAPAPRPTSVQPDERHDHPEPVIPETPEARHGGEPGAVDPVDPVELGLEHGDRALFLALARQRLSQGIPVNRVHPAPSPPPGEAPGFAPEPGYTNLVDDDLIGTFARAVEEAGGVCHVVEGEVPETLLDHIVAELGGWEAVVSAETEAVALGHSLAGRGVEVRQATPEAAARATLGLTSAIAGVAATGSIVLDSRLAGGRLASLLPPVHLCVLPAERVVAVPADVLRNLGDDPAALPSSLVLVTGPSRTGDIEQLLTIGAHGPTALHVIVVT
jgi:L-lactate dehydrogenase complex protein LldG